MSFKISGGIPFSGPIRINKHGLISDLFAGKKIFAYGGNVFCVNCDSVKICKLFKPDLRKIFTMFETVEGTVDIGPCIGYHFYLSNLKSRPFFIVLPRLFPAKIVADHGGG